MTQQLRSARSADPTDAEIRAVETRQPGDRWRGRPGRSVWLWAAGGFAVIALGAGAYAVSRGDAERAPAASAAPGGAAVSERVLGSGSAGAFAVSVTGLECGLAAVGPDDLRQPAVGQFCLVSVSVKNNGTQPALLDGGAQQAVDAAGRAYPVADRAAVFLNEQQPSLLDEVLAGATVRGVLPFDVPAGTKLSALTVRESMDGAAVRVAFS